MRSLIVKDLTCGTNNRVSNTDRSLQPHFPSTFFEPTMRIAIPFFAALLLSGLAQAADEPGRLSASANVTSLSAEDKRAVMERFNSFNAAFESRNYEVQIGLTYPPIIDMMGGRENYIKALKKSDEGPNATVIKFESLKSVEPTESIGAGDADVCIIPLTSIMTVNGVHVRETSFMLAVRKKSGKSWTLINGFDLLDQPTMLSQLLPGLPHSVQLPPNKLEKIDASGMPIAPRRQSAAELAKTLNQKMSLPFQVDGFTSLTSVTGSGDTLTYSYTVNDESVPAESIDAIVDQVPTTARTQICKSSSTSGMLDDGYTIAYNYAFRKSGRHAHVEVKPGSCST